MQPLNAPAAGEAVQQGSGRAINPLASLRKHKRVAAAVFALVILAGIPLAWKKGKASYRAEGVLYISPRFLSNLETSEEHQLQSNQQYREFMQQQIRTVNRFDILDDVLKQPGLMAAWKLPNESPRRAVERLQGALKVASVPDTYQVTVGMEGDKAAGLADLVNAVMTHFTAVSQKELMWDSTGRLENLRKEKANVEAEMAGLIERRTQMAEQLGTTVFSDSVVNSYDKRLAAALDALEEAKRQRFAAETALSAEAAPGLNATALDKAMTDTGVASLRGALNTRKAALLTSVQGLSPQHSGRIAAEKEIREIDAQIDRLTAQVHGRVQSGLEDINRSRFEQTRQIEARIQSEVDLLRGQTESFSRGYQNTLEIGDEVARLRRRLNATEDRINFLDLETAAPGFVRVFTPAMTPELPFQGGRKKLLLMVLLAALVLGAAAPLAVDFIDPHIMTARELEAKAGMPLSGEFRADGDGAAVKRLAVVLKRHSAKFPRKAVVVTGLSGGPESAAVSRALARELGTLGVRTLLVCAQPGPGESRPGLAELLSGKARLGQCIVSDIHAGDCIPCGAASLDADLLPADGLAQILDGANYDLVLIDAAPVRKSLAAEELVRIAGAALLVVTAEKDKKADLTEGLQLLSRLQPQAFGLVMYAPARTIGTRGSKETRGRNGATTLLAA